MKRENGITLISLVITAMVMAILAGITISATIGDDGLLTTAQNQKEKIKNSSVVAQAQIQLMKQSENDESGINYNELGKNLVQSKMEVLLKVIILLLCAIQKYKLCQNQNKKR